MVREMDGGRREGKRRKGRRGKKFPLACRSLRTGLKARFVTSRRLSITVQLPARASMFNPESLECESSST